MVWLLVILVWLVATLVIWNAIALPRVAASAAGATGTSISVLIPARNEARRIGPLLKDLSRCRTGIVEILVYDDHSTDETAQLIEQARSHDERIRRLSPEPLPPGWRGKPFACARLADAARGEWLVFLDADVRLAPEAPARLVAEATARRVSFLSGWPGLILESFAERWLMPLLNYVVYTLYPAPLSFRFSHPSLGLAHGACIVCRAADYRAVGGHERVREELFEDTRLARVWRASGRSTACLDAQEVVRTRMYDSFGAIWNGFSKNLGPAFRRRWSFLAFLFFHAVLGVGPFVAALLALLHRTPADPALLSVIGIYLIRFVQAARYHYRVWSVLLHPAAVVLMLLLAIVSRVRYETQGVEWKGRSYRREPFVSH